MTTRTKSIAGKTLIFLKRNISAAKKAGTPKGTGKLPSVNLTLDLSDDGAANPASDQSSSPVSQPGAPSPQQHGATGSSSRTSQLSFH